MGQSIVENPKLTRKSCGFGAIAEPVSIFVRKGQDSRKVRHAGRKNNLGYGTGPERPRIRFFLHY
jgi:hypothetical protein